MTRIGRSALWAYVSLLGGMPLSAALLPLLLWRFSLEQLAVWYLIQNLGQLTAIAETALEPSLTRYLTYARGGVARLPGYGEPPETSSGQENTALVQEVIGAARWLHRSLSGVNLILFGLGGALLLAHLAAPLGDLTQVLTAWGLYCLAQAMGTRWMAAIPLLLGSGHGHAAFRAFAIQRLVFGVVAALGLVLAGRLEVLGLAQLAGVCAGLWPAMWLARRHLPWAAPSLRPALAKTLLRAGAALWLSRLGGYLVARANLPVLSAALGLGVAGRLALTMQLIDMLINVAQTPMFASLPRLYELSAQGAIARSKAIVGRVFIFGWLSFVSGGIVLWAAGDELLSLLGKPGVLLGWAPLGLMLVGGLLDLNFSISATLLMVGNRVPFVFASLVSGLLVVMLNALALTLTPAGLMTALSIPLIVQASYNYWKWPLECLRLFQTSYPALLKAAWRTRS